MHCPYGMQSGYYADISMAATATHHLHSRQLHPYIDSASVTDTHRTVAGQVVCINGASGGAAAQAQRGCWALLGQQALWPGHRRKPRAHVRANLAPMTPQLSIIAGIEPGEGTVHDNSMAAASSHHYLPQDRGLHTPAGYGACLRHLDTHYSTTPSACNVTAH